MATLFDPTTQQAVSVPDAQAPDAVAAGRYLDRIPVVSPDGTAGTLPAENAHLLGQGYRYVSPDETAAKAKAAKYGTTGQNAIGALEQVASGATFGLAPAIEKATGLATAEDIQGREEQLPQAERVGANVVGSFLPALASSGLGALGKAGQAARAAEGVEGLASAAEGLSAASGAAKTTSGLTALAEAAPEAQSALEAAKHAPLFSRLVHGGASGMAQGGAYQLGTNLSDAYLQDKPLTAETLMAGVGPSALIGGGLGLGLEGALGLTERYVSPTLERARARLDGAQQEMTRAADKVAAGAEGAAAPGAPAPSSPAPASASHFTTHLEHALSAADEGVEALLTQEKPKLVASTLGDWDAAGPAANRALETAKSAIEANPVFHPALGENALTTGLRDTLKQVEEHVATATSDAERFAALDAGSKKLMGLERLDVPVEAGTASHPVPPATALGPQREAIGQIRAAWQELLQDPRVFGEAAQIEQRLAPKMAALADARGALERALMEGGGTAGAEGAASSSALHLAPDKIRAYLEANPRQVLRPGDVVHDYLTAARDAFDEAREALGSTLPAKGAGEVGAEGAPRLPTAQAHPAASTRQALDEFLAQHGVGGGGGGEPSVEVRGPRGHTETSPLRSALSTATHLIGRGGPLAMAAHLAGLHVAAPVYMAAHFVRMGLRATRGGDLAGRAMAKASGLAQRLTTLADAVLAPGAKAAGGALVASRGASSASPSPSSSGPSYREAAASVQKLAQHLQAGAPLASPTSSLGPLAEHLTLTASRQVAYLQSVLPQPPDAGAPSPWPGLQRTWTPSAGQQAEFLARYRAATDPTSVLVSLRVGDLSRAQVEAFQAVFPTLHAQVAQHLLSRIAEAGESGAPMPSFQARQRISLFVGAPLEPSLHPDMVAALQALASTQPGQEEAGMPGPGGSGSGAPPSGPPAPLASSPRPAMARAANLTVAGAAASKFSNPLSNRGKNA